MSLQDYIDRLFQFARRHGFRATIGRLAISCRRLRVGKWHILFVCDLGNLKMPILDDLKHANVERKNGEQELSSRDLSQIINVWNPVIARRQLSKRFARGASLWLFKLDGQIVAYGWTIIGGTMERHFMPLGENDAHLFDYFVFPEHRGRRINPALVNQVLSMLATERRSCAFIEAAEWNTAQLSSLARTPFRSFGRAWKLTFFKKTLVLWDDKASHWIGN